MIVAGHDAEIAAWVEQRLGRSQLYGNIFAAFGVVNDDGELVGGAVLHNWSAHDLEMTFYGPGSLRPSVGRYLAEAAFLHAGVLRVTVRVPRWNKTVLRSIAKFGWKHEGVQRRLYGPRKSGDAILFGLLREEAGRYLRTTQNVST